VLQVQKTILIHTHVQTRLILYSCQVIEKLLTLSMASTSLRKKKTL